MKKREGKEEKLHQQKLVKSAMLSSDFVSKATPKHGSQNCEGILNWFFFHIQCIAKFG
jgi:hypothetical protein